MEPSGHVLGLEGPREQILQSLALTLWFMCLVKALYMADNRVDVLTVVFQCSIVFFMWNCIEKSFFQLVSCFYMSCT